MFGHFGFPSSGVRAHAQRGSRGGNGFFEVEASGFARGSPAQAWAVMSDYERLADFVPDLESSRVLSRTGPVAIVEQVSRVGIMLMSYVVRMQVRIEERPMSAIDVSLISGDMRHYAVHWKLEPARQDGVDGTLLRFSGELEPQFFIPPMVGQSVVQANVRQLMEAVVSAIEKRSAH
ncbi:SRPBCC family protein [Noviherbaspirillum sp. CPCC 100848]|uniref:SRPBCC family protein n=1 Tax=Noviherbaspirillum album TaxID=3080276 RepID=A0ABU6JJB8_9BURK|nr:SRPBCC family protein [Noviherbaspirillum sp. CPCC 100848]MEC4723613.1 SRPBCC family protein [Noviherbaspirillum sp. CPCC 100848]